MSAKKKDSEPKKKRKRVVVESESDDDDSEENLEEVHCVSCCVYNARTSWMCHLVNKVSLGNYHRFVKYLK